jgi:hypothetical protein
VEVYRWYVTMVAILMKKPLTSILIQKFAGGGISVGRRGWCGKRG